MANASDRSPNRTVEEPDIDLRDENQAETQRAIRNETQDAFSVAPAGAVMTPAQAKGGVSGGLLGAVVGGAIGALIGLLPLFDMNLGVRVAVVASVCAVAGSLVGALLGGFFKPDLEGETGDLPGEGERDIAERRSGHAQ